MPARPSPRSLFPLRGARAAAVVAMILVGSQLPAPAQETGGTPTPALKSAPTPRAAEELLGRSRELEGSDFDGALRFAREALAEARRSGHRVEEIQALLQVGRTLRLLHDYPGTMATAREGLALVAAAGDEAARGKFLVLLGTTQWNLAQLADATGSFLEALRIADTLGDKALAMSAHNGLGLARARYDDHAGAVEHLEKALQLAEELNDPPRLASMLNNVGNHYLETKNYPRARELFERAVALLDGSGDNRALGYLRLNLGEVALATGDLALARQQLEEALAICTRHKIPRGIAVIHHLLATLERRSGRPDLARAHLQASLALAEKLNNPDLFVAIYREAVSTEEAAGDFRAALDYSARLAEKTEAIRGEKSRLHAAEVQARFEAEARTREIELLQRDKRLHAANLALKEAELRQARAQRYAYGAVFALVVSVVAAVVIGRVRARARAIRRVLEKTRVAKAQAEAASAQKSRQLSAATHDLLESEARFRSAFEHSALGIALVSLEGRWLRVNQALCDIVGYTPEEMLALDFQAFTHPDDLRADLQFVGELLRGERASYHMEKRYLHKTGEVVWIWLDVSLVREPGTDEPRYFVSQVQDITTRKRAEEHLRAAKAEAERANAAKNEFLSRISHELRTPLNAILGFGQLLQMDRANGARQRESVDQILTAGRHLLGLIDEVLDITQIEAGRLTVSHGPASLRGVVRETLELLRPLAAANAVWLADEVGIEAGAQVKADPQRLKQVLLNLLSNAVNYNRRGGSVSLAGARQENGRWRLTVTDTGVGMTAAEIEKIFAPFTRLPAAQRTAGSGLGLALSKALTEAMGGTLGVRSEPGQGSEFWVEFPAAENALLPVRNLTPGAGRNHDGDSVPGTQSPTVLYIEDNVANLQLVEHLFANRSDRRLLSATHGGLGLELARKQRPDVILLDVHLPDMPGAEVLRALREQPETAAVPIIVISADATTAQIRRFRALGACDYITKPFDLKELLAAVDAALAAAVAATTTAYDTRAA